MALHLIKLCVGASTPQDLRDWRAERAAKGVAPIVHTRQTPKRAEEILEGGSLYWVIKGQILLRETVIAINTLGEGAQRRCEIHLTGVLVEVAPAPRRAFQGWRYFKLDEAPPDLASGEGGEAMPADLALRLREMGAW